jgi:phosphoesterase RecJ-like protein
MKKIGLDKTVQLIDRSNNILILGHVNPDGDCIGSMAALTLGLRTAGKKVSAWSDEHLPLKYHFIKIDLEKPDQKKLSDFDLIVVLDTAVETRIGAALDFSKLKTPLLAIDHHVTAKNNFTYIHADQSQAATGCIVYDILKLLNIEIEKHVAEAIYTAIITDTGRFSYSNTNYRTFEITLELLKTGIDTSKISSVIYNSNAPEYIRILGAALNTLELVVNGAGAIMYVSAEMMKKEGLETFDTEDFVNYPKSITTVKVACMITETPGSDVLRMSLRSKTPDIDVSKLAKSFNGGGHKCASGARINESLTEFIPKLKKELEKFIRTVPEN